MKEKSRERRRILKKSLCLFLFALVMVFPVSARAEEFFTEDETFDYSANEKYNTYENTIFVTQEEITDEIAVPTLRDEIRLTEESDEIQFFHHDDEALSQQQVNDFLPESWVAYMENAPIASEARQVLVENAYNLLNTPYVWGGNLPHRGMDCSGLSSYCYRQIGVGLPRTARSQEYTGISIPLSEAQPGDLLFFGRSGYASHVGMYVGNGQMIHASQGRGRIVLVDLNHYNLTSLRSTRRMIAD